MCAFWKGKLELTLDKYTFAPGETITGNINLKLKKRQKARKMEVKLLGQEKTSERYRRSDGSMGHRTHIHTICNISIPLDGEKEYHKSDYKFEITIPPDVLDVGARPDGTLGTVLQAAEYLSGRRRNLVWKIIANLDIPWGFDVSNKQKIVVRKED